MFQFTVEERKRLRQRSASYPATIARLKKETDAVFNGKMIVPKEGIADWALYYYCPECSVKLEFNRESPHEHRCPSCKKVFTGEPYDGAWWALINGQNYNAVFAMAVIWLATGERAYADKAIQILKEYAMNYPNYEVHGNIPYNGPGRSGAQTLDEANFQRTFAMAYDILSECMSEEEKNMVRDFMFLPGAEFLLKNRHKQLHNHEVIINSAIAVIGILFQKQHLIDSAMYEKYGILYQLEHGMLDNNMWFEGAFSYHFYALTSFLAFEKFAIHTKYSQIHHCNYKKMLEMPCAYMDSDFRLPMLNDANYGHSISSMKELYEFAYRELGGEKLAFVLNTYYKDRERDNLEAFLYGADSIEPSEVELKNYHTEIGHSGHTVLRGEQERYLLLKHDAYGGEHDHYDRLGISYTAYGEPIAIDLGTTGYGASMHYDYYKNTASHNTLVIGEENQAPVNGRLTKYEEKDGVIYVEAEADWTKPYEMPDSFTIVQWSEENYRTVKMHRQIIWTEHYFIDVLWADGLPEDKTSDWSFHINGEMISEHINGKIEKEELLPQNYFEKKPLKYLHDAKLQELSTGSIYKKTYQAEKCSTSVYGFGDGQQVITAKGPDNPSMKELNYLIERRMTSKMSAVHVIESWKEEETIKGLEVEQKEDKLNISIWEKDKKREFTVSLKNEE